MKSKAGDPLTLDQMVPKYHIGFRMQPGEAAVVSGRIVHMTCRLELGGHHDSRVQCDGASCAACIQVLQSLFEVADSLRPIERETFGRIGGACETRAHYASTAGPGHEVTLGLEMILRAPLGTMSDSWAWIFMQRVRTALAELGCRNRVPAESVGCRPPFPVTRRRQIDHGAAGADGIQGVSRLIA